MKNSTQQFDVTGSKGQVIAAFKVKEEMKEVKEVPTVKIPKRTITSIAKKVQEAYNLDGTIYLLRSELSHTDSYQIENALKNAEKRYEKLKEQIESKIEIFGMDLWNVIGDTGEWFMPWE